MKIDLNTKQRQYILGYHLILFDYLKPLKVFLSSMFRLYNFLIITLVKILKDIFLKFLSHYYSCDLKIKHIHVYKFIIINNNNFV